MLKIKFMNKEKFLDRYKGKCTFVSLDDDMVTLSCPVHGQFIRSVYYALRVPDCPVCIREKEQKRKSYTQESFIEKAKELYPEYDYSLVKYVNSKTKITIIKNGEKYIVSPAHFLMNGIPDKKENPNKSNTEEFIKKAKAVWGDKYDYSLVDYKGVQTPVKIICPHHGIFEQRPNRHLAGANCLFCSNNRTYFDDFVKRANKIHNNKYQYKEETFHSLGKQTTIVCPIHGDFLQIAGNHLDGHGCRKCACQEPYTQESFIEKAKSIWSDKIDFDNTEYVDLNTKIAATCKIHGVFKTSPKNILYGNACPKCSRAISKPHRKLLEAFPDIDWSVNDRKVLKKNP